MERLKPGILFLILIVGLSFVFGWQEAVASTLERRQGSGVGDVERSPLSSMSSVQTIEGVVINEYLPVPSSGNSEYVELYNTNDFAVDLTDAQIDDIVGGFSPYTIEPDNALIPANGHLLYTRNFGLNNGGDSVRLIAADGSVADIHSYSSNPGSDIPWSRSPDGGVWRDDLPQSPGVSNPGPPTSTPTPIPPPTGVLINEYLPAPASGESEYVELFNTNTFAIDLNGWQIDDIEEGGSTPYAIPSDNALIPAQGHLLYTRKFGLNNGGDTVRLIAADGSLRDSHSYSSNPGTDIPWSRFPDGGTWRTDLPQSPGQPNPAPPTSTPTATFTSIPTPTQTGSGYILTDRTPFCVVIVEV